MTLDKESMGQIDNASRLRLKAFFSYTMTRYWITYTYSTIETKEAARIGYNEFPFPHEYSGLVYDDFIC